jgi:hypothetical protein
MARPVENGEEQARHAQAEAERTRQVERIAPRRPRFLDIGSDEGKGEHPEGQVDGEDRAPSESQGHPRAEERSEEARHSPQGAEESLHPGTLADAVKIADDGEGGGEKPSRPHPLEPAGQDELRHRVGEGARRSPQEEEDDRDEQDEAPAVEVGQAAVEGHGDGRGEEIDREDPGVEG